uniref:Uncharacterized protein n=1 Tax=Triticum urartu TaxID=4572 RepID=A0A8R7QM61_TRIUA
MDGMVPTEKFAGKVLPPVVGKDFQHQFLRHPWTG